MSFEGCLDVTSVRKVFRRLPLSPVSDRRRTVTGRGRRKVKEESRGGSAPLPSFPFVGAPTFQGPRDLFEESPPLRTRSRLPTPQRVSDDSFCPSSHPQRPGRSVSIFRPPTNRSSRCLERHRLQYDCVRRSWVPMSGVGHDWIQVRKEGCRGPTPEIPWGNVSTRLTPRSQIE